MLLAVVEGLLLLGVLLVLVLIARVVVRGMGGRAPAQPARWEAAHYAARGSTRVVVRKVGPGGGPVHDEHVVAVIDDGDPDYEAVFLDAMARARDRAALYDAAD